MLYWQLFLYDEPRKDFFSGEKYYSFKNGIILWLTNKLHPFVHLKFSGHIGASIV